MLEESIANGRYECVFGRQNNKVGARRRIHPLVPYVCCIASRSLANASNAPADSLLDPACSSIKANSVEVRSIMSIANRKFQTNKTRN